MSLNIGFVGLGTMGGRMAARLIDKGHQLTVVDPNPAAIEKLVVQGARAVASPQEAAEASDIVCTSLPSQSVYLDVLLGRDGVVNGRPVKVVVDFSTVGRETTAIAAAALSAQGIDYVDAPVSGSPPAARDGTLTLMVAGSRSAIALTRPILEAIGHRIVELGGQPGLGQSMKLVNNFLSATALAASAEAVVMGVKAGLDPNKIIETLNAGSGRNSATVDKIPNDVIPRRFAHGFATGLLLKDVALYLEEARILGVPTAIGDIVRDLWLKSAGHSGSDADCTRIFELIENVAGVSVSYPDSSLPKMPR